MARNAGWYFDDVNRNSLGCNDASGRSSNSGPKMSKWYNADLGSWERGTTVEFEAEDDQDALEKAIIKAQMLSESADVVQIRPGKKKERLNAIYDFMNGFYRGIPQDG